MHPLALMMSSASRISFDPKSAPRRLSGTKSSSMKAQSK
jgi:hypothetical protein